ncbi:hypothetical protein JZ751_023170 [Albula glossodonta]|uniref:Uncharacterized protein n=1 Tax=Albula glossodonta TaxID=121402 RepID=A0A8T2PIA4_9TELE|nr:hypothetical protein JZ751_023170 [Albula glossodonta]
MFKADAGGSDKAQLKSKAVYQGENVIYFGGENSPNSCFNNPLQVNNHSDRFFFFFGAKNMHLGPANTPCGYATSEGRQGGSEEGQGHGG